MMNDESKTIIIVLHSSRSSVTFLLFLTIFMYFVLLLKSRSSVHSKHLFQVHQHSQLLLQNNIKEKIFMLIFLTSGI